MRPAVNDLSTRVRWLRVPPCGPRPAVLALGCAAGARALLPLSATGLDVARLRRLGARCVPRRAAASQSTSRRALR